jgi:ligand-binding SRPBCC domain-containing protein
MPATHVLEREQLVPREPGGVFSFYADARNLEAITPPWLGFRITTPGVIEMRPGTVIEYRLRLHGVPVRWRTRIVAWEPGAMFCDLQLRGPYRHWEHLHTFEPVDGGTIVRDRVTYALPLGPLGRLAHALVVRRDLEAIFDFRQQATARALRYSAA